MTDPRDEIDLKAWEVDDDLPETFADAVLAEVDAREGRGVVDGDGAPVPTSKWRRWTPALLAGAAAAGLVLGAGLVLRERPSGTSEPEVAIADGFDGVGVTPQADATWRFLSASTQSAIAEQTAGRVRWDAQRGVPLTVQTPAGRVSTTRADFTLEILDMSVSDHKKQLAVGTAFAGTVAALVWMHAGEVEVANEHGQLSLGTPGEAVMSDAEAPRAQALAATPGKAKQPAVAKRHGTIDWVRARDAIEKTLASREPHPADDADPVPPATADGVPLRGKLDKEYIRNTVREDVVPLVRDCYNDLLAKDPLVSGRMILQFRIMGDESVGGIVDDMQFAEDSEIADPDFRECLAESMMSTVFAPPEGGGEVLVTYPIIFEVDPDPSPEDVAEVERDEAARERAERDREGR